MPTETPYYKDVPKDLQANIAYRQEVLRMGAESRKNAEDLWVAASRDILWYINVFGMTSNPKESVKEPIIPFITYDYQDDAILKMNDAIGIHDVCIGKSREMGATWISLALFEWRWHFMPNQSFLLASRDQTYVDKSGNPKALFQKIDFILKHQPCWLKPNMTRTDMRLANEDNDSVINGESSTGALGAGDRRTAVFWDEVAKWDRSDGFKAIASTSAVTNTRIINSTPEGTGNAYHELFSKSDHKIRMHWSQHPEQSKGLYTVRNGKLEILDKKYEFPADYKFILDGKFTLRSIYFDKFCKKVTIDSLVKQELEIDFLGSGSQFYPSDMVPRMLSLYARPALVRGELLFDELSGRPTGFQESKDGKLSLWIHPVNGRPPKGGQYSMGVDIAVGTGASNSVISVGDTQTGEKVCEFKDKHTRPEALATYAVALARWFNEAFMIPEANGPGREFIPKTMELGYRNHYYMMDEGKNPPARSEKPGWYSTKVTKRVLLSEYGQAMISGLFINRSEQALNECNEVVFAEDGNIIHVASAASFDPTGAGENHADCVIADALCCKGMKQRPADVTPEEAPLPYYCMESRRQRQEAEDETDSDCIF